MTLTSSDAAYWFSWQHRVQSEDLKELEKEAHKRHQQALLELAAAEEVLGALRCQLAWSTLYDAGVRHDGRVIVDYADGPVEAVFVGVETSLGNQIVLRHLTKKGTPEKQPRTTSFTMAEYIRPKVTPEQPKPASG